MNLWQIISDVRALVADVRRLKHTMSDQQVQIDDATARVTKLDALFAGVVAPGLATMRQEVADLKSQQTPGQTPLDFSKLEAAQTQMEADINAVVNGLTPVAAA
jgi:hypothetical protein